MTYVIDDAIEREKKRQVEYSANGCGLGLVNGF